MGINMGSTRMGIPWAFMIFRNILISSFRSLSWMLRSILSQGCGIWLSIQSSPTKRNLTNSTENTNLNSSALTSSSTRTSEHGLSRFFPLFISRLFLTNSYKCNTNPYLGIPNTFIAELLPQMLNDMLRITLGKLFKKKNKSRTRNTNKDTSKKDKDLGKDILKNDKAEESDYGFPNGF